MSKQLVDGVVDRLMERIVAGEFDGAALPREKDLAEQCDVSRLTLREAVKVLTSAGVLRIERGRGTYVNDRQRWSDVALIARTATDSALTSVHLLETRRIIEVGAIQLAVSRLDDAALDAMQACIDAMVDAHEEGDVLRFATADLDFHLRIMQGTGNPFISALYAPIADTLRAGREETSSHATVREHAIGYHREILTALRDRDVTASVDSMMAHIRQTLRDLEHYVLGSDEELHDML